MPGESHHDASQIDSDHHEHSEIKADMGLIETKKKMNELRNENYDLKVQVTKLKKDMKKFISNSRSQNTGSAGTISMSQSKIFEPKSEFLDDHKRMQDLSDDSSSDQDNDNLSVTEKYSAEIEHHRVEIDSLKDKLETTNEICTRLREQLSQSENTVQYQQSELSRLKPLEEYPKLLRAVLNVPEGQSLSIEETVELIDQKISPKPEEEDCQSNNAVKPLEDVISILSQMIDLCSSKSPVDELKCSIEKASSDLHEVVRDCPQNFDKFDLSKIVKKLQSHFSELQHDEKTLTQYPIENLKDDVTIIESPSMMVSKTVVSNLPVSTPLVSKKLHQLRNDYLNLSTEMFKSVSALKSEYSVMCSTEYGSRMSANFPVANEPHNTVLDGTTVGNSTMFDKSDLQFANVNALIIKVEQLVNQNNQIQEDIVQKLKEHDELKSQITSLDAEVKTKDEVNQTLKDRLADLQRKLTCLEEISCRIQAVFGCDEESVLDVLDQVRDTIESLSNNNEELEQANQQLTHNNQQLKEQVDDLAQDVKRLSEENEEMRANEAAAQDSSPYDDSHLVHTADPSPSEMPIRVEELPEMIDVTEWNQKFDELRDMAIPMFETYKNIFEALKSKLPLKSTSAPLETPPSKDAQVVPVAIQTSLSGSIVKKDNSSVVDHSQQVVQQPTEDKETTSQLNLQICLLKSEIKDAHDQIELLKISQAVPESQKNDSKMFDLIEEMNRLQKLLEKSYENNRSLRTYLNSIFQNSAQTVSINPESKTLRVFTKDEISSVEKSTQDCLALLRNMAKLVKAIESLQMLQTTSDEVDKLRLNLYKTRKIMKIMQKNFLQTYRTIISSENYDASNKQATTVSEKENLSKDMTDSPDKDSLKTAALTSHDESALVVKSTKGREVGKLVDVFEKRNL